MLTLRLYRGTLATLNYSKHLTIIQYLYVAKEEGERERKSNGLYGCGVDLPSIDILYICFMHDTCALYYRTSTCLISVGV